MIFFRFKIEFLVTIPKIITKSNYELSWKLGGLNLEGKGDSSANLDNVKVLLKLYGSRYMKNGVEYIKFDDAKITIKPKNLSVRYENLFNGQKALEEVGNQFINENIDTISADIIPQVERGIEEKILKVANQILEKATAEEFFPTT